MVEFKLVLKNIGMMLLFFVVGGVSVLLGLFLLYVMMFPRMFPVRGLITIVSLILIGFGAFLFAWAIKEEKTHAP